MRTVPELFSLLQNELSTRAYYKEPQELYDPINYIMKIGGKRLRPILLLMAYELFDSSVENGLPAAYAIEIFHNFTLVHDDIMDEANLRRGKDTVHHKYDINTGILSGDVMLIYAYQSLMELQENKAIKAILNVFNEVAIGVCEGQQMDMNFETRDDVQLEEYLKMIQLKTAVLLGGAMQIGALAAGASTEDAQHAYEFGVNTGIAFQLQDDLLDSFGDPEKFGKKVGGDIIQNKKTYLVLKSLELADDVTKTELLYLMSTTNMEEVKKVEAVKAIFTKLDIPNQTSEIKKLYQEKAFDHLNKISVPDEKKQRIKVLAEEMLGREE